MKKRKLLVLGLFLFLIPFACNQREEADSPVTEVGDSENFDKVSAQAYFETNATDLAPLSFAEDVHDEDSRVEMVPQWENAMESANDEIRVVEVPIWSNSLCLGVENVMENGKLAYQKFTVSQRRLIVVHYRTGETSMFVVTIQPSATAEGNAEKSLENFRYLGGGDFTGRVFCSMLDGRFIKAFGYVSGQPAGRLVMKADAVVTETLSGNMTQIYSVIDFHESVQTRAETYPIGELVACGICGNISCTCECWVCHKKKTECSCSKCPKCGKKGSECSCKLCPNCNQELSGCKCPKCSKCNNVPAACTCYCSTCKNTGSSCYCVKCPICKFKLQECKCARCGECDNIADKCTCGKCPDCLRTNALCACPPCLICREKPAKCKHKLSTRSQEGTAGCDHDHNVPDPWTGSIRIGAEETVFFRHCPDC